MAISFMNDLSMLTASLKEGGSQLFPLPLKWAILSNGDADFHDNVIFFGFDDRHTNPILVAKVPRLVENGWMLQVEYDHLVDLWDCIGATAADFVPKPYAMSTLQGRPALLISYISGESLTRLSPRSFWRDSEQVSGLARQAAYTLRRINDLTERPLQPGEALKSDIAEKADKFREIFELTAEEDYVLKDLVNRLEGDIAQADHKVLIQGDFWHGNMIRDERQGTLKLVDWQFARWSMDVSLDVYFFLLAAAQSAMVDVPLEQRAKEAFRLLDSWRVKVIPEYLSAYGKPEHYVLLPQRYGMLACCVDKAVRSAFEFGYRHPTDQVWRELFAELLPWPDES